MAASKEFVEYDSGIPYLVRSLAADSKRLLGDEVQLAKLELRESFHHASAGAHALAWALAAGIVVVVTFTLFVATLIGRFDAGHMWLGALVAGALDVIAGIVLLKRGASDLHEPAAVAKETKDALS